MHNLDASQIRTAPNAARALILEHGIKWQQISVSPEDAELLGSPRFSTEELARIFQVPPPLVGIWDHSSFTNSETARRWFAQHTLAPWLRKIEAEFSRSIFGAGSNSYFTSRREPAHSLEAGGPHAGQEISAGCTTRRNEAGGRERD